MKRTNITLTYNELMHIEKCLEDNLNWNEMEESKLLERVREEIRKMNVLSCRDCTFFCNNYCKEHGKITENNGYCEEYLESEILGR